MHNKIISHKRFWRGEGPGLVLIPPARSPLYDLNNYAQRFYNPRMMRSSEIERANAVIDWPTDGIPTIRPNLGVITVPAMAGQDFQLPEESMPWPGSPLSWEDIQAIRDRDITQSKMFELAAEFYQIHSSEKETNVAAYLPDTQGVFDIAHMLYGKEIFLSMIDPDNEKEINELMDISLDLYIRVTKALKNVLNEEQTEMIHGHGTEQGIYFPAAGTRISEDTATLLSPEMIDQYIIPFVRRSIEPFGGAFLHFCGYHPSLFSQLTALEEVKAVDFGNPEKYDLREILERCAQTDTVLYSRIAELPDENWEQYIRRIGSLVSRTGARVILRPKVFPESSDECLEMLEQWHYLTTV